MTFSFDYRKGNIFTKNPCLNTSHIYRIFSLLFIYLLIYLVHRKNEFECILLAGGDLIQGFNTIENQVHFQNKSDSPFRRCMKSILSSPTVNQTVFHTFIYISHLFTDLFYSGSG